MNKTSLTGRIANDLELRKTQQGKSVLEVNLAVRRERKNQDGEYPVDFIRVYAWEQKAEFLKNYTRKGTLIGVTGRIETGSYTNQNNQKVNTTYIQAETVEILAHPQEKKTENVPNNIRTENVNAYEDYSGFGGNRSDLAQSAGIEPDELPFY